MRKESEILEAAGQFQEMADFGDATGDLSPAVSRPHGMAKVAEALRWAAGEENEVSALLRRVGGSPQ